MTREPIGTTPATALRDQELYLDFVEGLMAFLPRIEPAVRKEADAAVAHYRERTGHEPLSLEEAHAALDRVPIVATRNRIRRTTQEMKWYGLVEAYRAREAEFLAELDAADRMGPGSVEYDPNFPVPEYARREIHLMPGGYTGDPLAGYLYQYGTKVFFAGGNNADEVQRKTVNALPIPADGQVRRILDLGCSSGQSATALKERFPEAEVWGIDVGAPMVRYAHKRAVEMGLEVHFAQRLAEDTRFPDAYFDIVHAFILFHELPVEIGRRVVAEARRILRPGGLFLVTDFGTPEATGGRRGALGEVYGHIDSVDNCEPYAYDFTHSDFEATLRKHFSSVAVTGQGGLPLRIATA